MSQKTTTAMRSHAERVLTHQAAQARAENGADTPDPGQVAVPADPSFVAGLATGLKVKRRVTTPVLPFPEGSAIVCRIIDPIHESAIEGDNRFGGAPASVCTVEAQNGEVRILIAGTVLRKALERDYPNASYVALWFHIAKLARPDKAYADYAITEIEDPTPAAL